MQHCGVAPCALRLLKSTKQCPAKGSPVVMFTFPTRNASMRLHSIYLNGSDWYEGGVFKHPKQHKLFNSYGLFKISIKNHP